MSIPNPVRGKIQLTMNITVKYIYIVNIKKPKESINH